jgi:UDP-N-acetylmuramate dehydrogenase
VRGADLTTLGIGGEIKNLFKPEGEEELISLMGRLHSEGSGFHVIGGGSNVLMTDEALETPLILTTAMNDIRVQREGDILFVSCGAGVRLPDLFAMTVKEGWSGMEFASGIPGTVGGAVIGNAGTPHGETGSVVHSVRLIRPGGGITDLGGGAIRWGYRTCSLTERMPMVLSGVVFRFRESTRERVLGEARRSADTRRNQPSRRMTAGCVFKNPPGDSAGRLLELAGCKGLTYGRAVVSSLHANFIENPGGATAGDVARLAMLCREKVRELFGVCLQFEIRTLGISLGD